MISSSFARLLDLTCWMYHYVYEKGYDVVNNLVYFVDEFLAGARVKLGLEVKCLGTRKLGIMMFGVVFGIWIVGPCEIESNITSLRASPPSCCCVPSASCSSKTTSVEELVRNFGL